MSQGPDCPNCGSEIPVDAASELCPKCLLRQVLLSLEDDPGGSDLDTSDAQD